MFRDSYRETWILMALVAVSVAGCGRLNPGQTLAVLDLDRAVKDSGMLEQVDEQMAGVRRDLQSQLGQLQQRLNAGLANAKEAMGTKPSEEQQTEHARRVRAASGQLAQARQRADGILENRRSQLMAQARRQVGPVAREVSGARGVQAVLLAGAPALFDYDRAIDITDAVVVELRRTAPRVSLPQAPAAKGDKPAPDGQSPAEGGR
ncbi:MAG: OmpH family outer membrane protein [Chromatiales bacterium]|jgi:Skp family chaperone for outer membrane proteins